MYEVQRFLLMGLLLAILFGVPLLALSALVYYWRKGDTERLSITLGLPVITAAYLGLFYSDALNPLKTFGPNLEGTIGIKLYLISLGVGLFAAWRLIRSKLALARTTAGLFLLLASWTVVRAGSELW